MKYLKLMAFLTLIIGCSQTGHLEVKSIDILPPGGDVDSVTAYVDLQGTGIARLDWERRAYGVDSLMQTEYWYIDSSDVYTSTLSVTDGWYWLSIYDEDSILLAVSDTIFCGTGSQLPPVADFYGEPTSGEAPLWVQFYDQSLNDPTIGFWDFGDGESSEGDPRHRYEEPGSYDVTWTVSNIAGTDTLTKKNYIQVELPDPPVAGFYAEPTEGESPLWVEFYNQSSGGGTFFMLDYGDGYSTLWRQSTYLPGHSYKVAGIYTVTLMVKNDWGADTMIREDYISVTEPYGPEVHFDGTPRSGSAPLEVTFYNYSICTETGPWPHGITSTWIFGDGFTKTLPGKIGTTHSYQECGSYTVSLIMKDTEGVDTLTKEDYINVIWYP